MGLFDNIKCKVALPVPKEQGELANEKWLQQEFQTKDLVSALMNFEIRADGTLWREEKKGWEQDKHTGGVNFYHHLRKNKNDYWVEFVAFFENGKLVKNVTLVKWDEEDNAERKEQEAKLDAHIMKESRRRKCWHWRLFCAPWNRFIRWGCRLDRRFHRWCLRLIDKWEQWATIGR